MVDSPETVVKRWLLDETDDKLNSYLGKLNSPETLPYITWSWIKKHLPLSRYDIPDWIDKGFIPFELIHKDKGHHLYTHEGGVLIGYIWYFRENGHPLNVAVLKAEIYLKREKLFNCLPSAQMLQFPLCKL